MSASPRWFVSLTARRSFDASTRFERISGDGRDGIWETKDYGESKNRATLHIDQESGSIHVKDL